MWYLYLSDTPFSQFEMVWRLTPNNSATCSCVSFFSIRAALILLPISCSMPLHLPCTFIVGKTPYIVYQMAFTSLIMCVKILLHLLYLSETRQKRICRLNHLHFITNQFYRIDILLIKIRVQLQCIKIGVIQGPELGEGAVRQGQ